MEELLNIMKAAHKDGFRSFGIRSINTRISGRANVGDILPESYDWDIEQDCSTYDTTGETLSGTCAVWVNTEWINYDDEWDPDILKSLESGLKIAHSYYGDECVLVGSKEGGEWGNDEREIILEDAQVLAIIE